MPYDRNHQRSEQMKFGTKDCTSVARVTSNRSLVTSPKHGLTLTLTAIYYFLNARPV